MKSCTFVGQPKELSFTNHTDGDSIVLEEGESFFLECRAEEVVPVPELRILSGEVDYTEHFMKSSILEVGLLFTIVGRMEKKNDFCIIMLIMFILI